MKNLFYFLLCLFVLTLPSCQDDDADIDPYLIHYDGVNFSSPFLPSGDYEAAVHFPKEETSLYGDKVLTAIDYHVYSRPDFAEIRISESNGNIPGNILYQEEVTDDLDPFAWNLITLPSPIDISQGLWVSLYFEHDENDFQVIGCDEGPGRIGGDWLYDENDSQSWQTYFARTNESINWNIRGILADR